MDYTNGILIFSTVTDFVMLQTHHNIFANLPAKYRNCREKTLGLCYNRLKEQTLHIYLEIAHLLLTFTIKLTFSNKTSYIGVYVEMTKGE